MYHPYELKALVNQRHEDALQEARIRRLANQARSTNRTRGSRRFPHIGLARGSAGRSVPVAFSLALLASIVILLGASSCTSASDSGSGSYDTSGSTTSASERSDATPSGDTTDHASEDTTEPQSHSDELDDYSATDEQYADDPAPSETPPEPVPEPESDTPTLAGAYIATRITYGMSGSSGSMECYEFYSDGLVKQYHNGATSPTDIGTYINGQIIWQSGRYSSVGQSGNNLVINGTQASPSLGGSCIVPQ